MARVDEATTRKLTYARNFSEKTFKRSITRAEELEAFVHQYLPEGYRATLPGKDDRINTFAEGKLALPLSHFEVGLRLPFWPEFRQILRYFGLVPAQINTNGIAIIMGFLCYLREERIPFDLATFRKIFYLGATRDGVIYFGSHLCSIVGTSNKVHRWNERFLLISGDFGGIPMSPQQPPIEVFIPPLLTGYREKFCSAMRRRRFDVVFWRQNVERLAYVETSEGVRRLPAIELPLAEEPAPATSPAEHLRARSGEGSSSAGDVAGPFPQATDIDEPGPSRKRKKEIARKKTHDRDAGL